MTDKNRKANKKQAMTLLSIMFMMIIVMVAITVAMPIVTKKTSPPEEESRVHGYFGCYCTTRDCSGNSMVSVRIDVTNGEQSDPVVSVGNSCNFAPPEGVTPIRMTLIGGGGSGVGSSAKLEFEELGTDTLVLTQNSMNFKLFDGLEGLTQDDVNKQLGELLKDVTIKLYGADAASATVLDVDAFTTIPLYKEETSPETGEMTQKQVGEQYVFNTISKQGKKGAVNDIKLSCILLGGCDLGGGTKTLALGNNSSVTISLGAVNDSNTTKKAGDTKITYTGQEFLASGGASYVECSFNTDTTKTTIVTKKVSLQDIDTVSKWNEIYISNSPGEGATSTDDVIGKPQGGRIEYVGQPDIKKYVQAFKAVKQKVTYTSMTTPAQPGEIHEWILDDLPEANYMITSSNIGAGGNNSDGNPTSISISGTVYTVQGGAQAVAKPRSYNGTDAFPNNLDLRYLKSLDGLKPFYNFPFPLVKDTDMQPLDGMTTDGQGGYYERKNDLDTDLGNLTGAKPYTELKEAVYPGSSETRNTASIGRAAVTPGRGGGSAFLAFPGLSSNNIKIYTNVAGGPADTFKYIYGATGGDGAAGAIIFEW